MRNKKQTILLFLKGMAMGAADSVPGVSGGTIAFISNIYEELIMSIRSLNLKALNILGREGIAACWRHINGNFLLVLVLGILTSLVLLANIVLYLLAVYPQQVYGFFSGLVLASSVYVAGKIHCWDASGLLLALLGAGLTLTLGFMPMASASASLPYIFCCGAIAICAMILPGISGAFILLLLGSYETVLDALRSFQISTIAVFICGCACGLLVFSNFLAWLFLHYHRQTLTFLFGILLGSLYSIWPWKIVLASRINEMDVAVPVLYRSVLPTDLAELTGGEVYLVSPLILGLAGFLLIFTLEKLARKPS